jgi:hypothetical protein
VISLHNKHDCYTSVLLYRLNGAASVAEGTTLLVSGRGTAQRVSIVRELEIEQEEVTGYIINMIAEMVYSN